MKADDTGDDMRPEYDFSAGVRGKYLARARAQLIMPQAANSWRGHGAAGVQWTHPSVVALAAEGDPPAVIVERARQLVFGAVENGWDGPPFDPIVLADLKGIDVEATTEVVDASIRQAESGRLVISFNPTQPRGRRRYSIAHEIGHALFEDVAQTIRFRKSDTPMRADDWQLEMLCNIAAAELLMPIGSLPSSVVDAHSIDDVLELRNHFDVSLEAVAIRLVHVTSEPLAVFAASQTPGGGEYRLNYFVPSPGWRSLGRPMQIPASSKVAEVTAIGHTSKAIEEWPGIGDKVRIEAVGLPPYRGETRPRIVGLLWHGARAGDVPDRILHVRGNALAPRGPGRHLVTHVVNDKTPRWGGGFAREVRRKWPEVQASFIEWAQADPANLRLGSVHIAQATSDIFVGSIVAQRGYGPSAKPRIRYGALEHGLRTIATSALRLGASVHAPRLGAGQSGGNWAIVEGLLEETLWSNGLEVTVYTLPEDADRRSGKSEQLVLNSPA
jgi:hypothetical protein